MRLPKTEIAIGGGLTCQPAEIARRAWQAHLLKHPVGVHAIVATGGRGPWNREGWDQVQPPVLTSQQREALVAAIAGLSQGSLRCGVPEIHRGGTSDLERLGCYDCPESLLVRCEQLCDGPNGLGPAYAQVTESLIFGVSEPMGKIVRRGDLSKLVTKLYRSPEKWNGLTVLSIGFVRQPDRLCQLVRITRSDGVRSEFYLSDRKSLSWRTTYRQSALTSPALASFLLEMPIPDRSLGPLSDFCIVARPWWESHE